MREMAVAMKRQADAATQMMQHIQEERNEWAPGECVVTSLACLNCPIVVDNRCFEIDLIRLNLSGIDVILGMNWLSENNVVFNCCEKPVMFIDTKPVRKRNEEKI
ncbi:Transposon Ty3-I Gag-Pol polyprotein [Senna tora]|uniref:Transposon Ty3-I Gag-Pol polyprotein n=1 Tax=Senna tora TaxID=362788 RepID=A0A834SC45_9FABA|nr:Transposon Ty3-I Gag-Pol polyprotein [Senna tora]